MGEPHVISGLKAKRARIAGEIIHAQEIVVWHTKELLAIDAVILLFSPDCDPEMIAPLRPTSRGLFFRYQELARLCMGILREAKAPLTLDSIIDQVVAAKGFPDDGRLRRRIYEITRASLLRMERRGVTRRILDQPDTWWELVR
jgi:hypothetical protein